MKWCNKGKQCRKDNCLSPAYCRGYCTKHYQRILGNGTLVPKIRTGPPTWEWMLSKSKINKNTDCIEWQGCLISTGYGETSDSKRGKIRTHRLAYELQVGPIPKGMLICHHCDNPLCINPEHLFAGTHKDNSQDMSRKNRNLKGEKNPKAKLTEKQVIEIFHSQEQHRTIGKQYGVSHALIGCIKRRKAWRHVNVG